MDCGIVAELAKICTWNSQSGLAKFTFFKFQNSGTPVYIWHILFYWCWMWEQHLCDCRHL